MAALRYTRQVRLAEVGARGQDRLSGLPARVRDVNLAAHVEALYLAGAGVKSLGVDSEEVAAAARALNPEVEVKVEPRTEAGRRPLLALRGGASEVADGALQALLVLRAALLPEAN